MEEKKNPKVNLESRKTTYVLTGLVASMSILFVGLEWATTERYANRALVRLDDFTDDEEIVMTVQSNVTPPPPPPAPDVITDFTVQDDEFEIEPVEIESMEMDDDYMVEIFDPSKNGEPVEEEEADPQEIHVVVEQQPEFPGGEAALMKFIQKTLKYPAFAVENNIQGRVTLSFVVEKDGSIADIQVMRSPAEELSKEGTRIVSSMPKWKPGRQHGKPVRVKYVLPITFRLA